MSFLGELIGAVGIFKGSFRMPVAGIVVASFIVFGSGPMGVGGEFVLFRGFPMGFVHGGLSSAGDRLARGPLMVSERLQLLAMRRLSTQRVAEFLRGCRSLEVAGQDLTIRGFAAVELTVGIVIRTQRGALERNAGKQPA